MVSLASTRELCRRLTKHCAEEAEHARLWAEVIEELSLEHVRIRRSFQSFFLEHSGPPRSLVEVLAFTQIFERRVHRRFHEELCRPGLPAPAARAYAKMIEDEKEHLSWVANWLAKEPQAPAELRRFEAADRAVFASIQPYEGRFWEIPGLGEVSTEETCL
jgi:rubrerythrin